MSRVDSFMASRRRAMFFHSVWRPMLAGAVGAALIVAAVWVASPKFVFRDIEIPRVTVRDVTVDHVVPRDVPVDHVVPHDVTVDHYVPRDVPMPTPTQPPGPQASADDAPKTPAEKKFVEQPAYKDAIYRGRIVQSHDGRSITFADGKYFSPARLDPATGLPVDAPDETNDSDPFVGDLGMCVENTTTNLWRCTAMHNGRETRIGHHKITPKSADERTPPAGSAEAGAHCPDASNGWHCGKGQTPPADAMVHVTVDLGIERVVNAMVDTGCSWPMSIPSSLADALVNSGHAEHTTPAKSTLADGTTHDTDVIVINDITVEGRQLKDVVAAVAPKWRAPILLGLGALNRLGPYTITDGRLVFAGDQPT